VFFPLSGLFFRSRSLADEGMEGVDANANAAGWLSSGPGGAQPLLQHASPSPKPCVPLLRAAAAATYTATSVRARCVSLFSHRRVEFAYINA